MAPAAFTDAGPDFTIAISACGVTVVVAVDELFPGVGSAVDVLTVAVFETVPDAGAVPVSVETNVPPLKTVPALHVNTPVVIAHPRVGVDAPDKFAGIESVIVTATALDGPLFVAVNV